MTESRIEDTLMDRWSGLWREPPHEDREEPPLEVTLERRQKRNARRFWVTVICEAVVALTGTGYALGLIANRQEDSLSSAQGLALLALLFVTTALGVLSRRGQWRAVDGSPVEVAALELRRARGRKLGCRIGWGVLAAVAGFVFWFLQTRGVELVSPRFAVLLLATLGYVVALSVLGRRAELEIRNSRELLQQLTDVDSSSSR